MRQEENSGNSPPCVIAWVQKPSSLSAFSTFQSLLWFFHTYCPELSVVLSWRNWQNYVYTNFPGGSDGKEYACNAGDTGLIPGSEKSPGEGNGHPSILAWRIPCTEEPGRLQSIGSQRVRHNWVTNTFTLIFVFLNLLPLEKTTTLYQWVTLESVQNSQVYSLMNFHTLNPPSTQIQKKRTLPVPPRVSSQPLSTTFSTLE